MWSKTKGKQTTDQHKHNKSTFIINHNFGEISRAFHFTKTQHRKIQVPYDEEELNSVEQDQRETHN